MKQRNTIRHCKSCGDPITAPRKKFYCSTGCRNQAAMKPSAQTEGHDENGKAPARPCIQCTTPFQPHWRRPDARFCSRKCQGLGINAQGLGPRHDDDELLARLTKVINAHQRCLSQEELMAEAGTTHKVLRARNWTMEFLYGEAGRTYERPRLSSRFEERVYSVVGDLFPDSEIETDKPLSGMHGFKKGKLLADMFIKDMGLIIEADGKQHLTGRDDPEKLEYIRANDRLKDEYAACHGLALIRVAETVDVRTIRAQLLRGIRRVRPGFRPPRPSITANGASSKRRMPKRRNASARPRRKLGDMGEPLYDVYCRGCHTRPSFKNGNTYFCPPCWDRWNEVRRSARVLTPSEAPTLKGQIVEFIKSRGRYVWHPEVYIHLRAITAEDLKSCGIKVARICRELGYYAPADDRLTLEFTQRVRAFVELHIQEHGRTPGVCELRDGLHIDTEALWAHMDYEAYIAELGGTLATNVRHRFRDADEFLEAAIQVVKEAGHFLPITSIVKKLGMCHPAYLAHFKHIRTKEIHQKAGVPIDRDRPRPE